MSILALTSNTLVGTAGSGQIEYDGQFFGTDSNASRAQLQRIVRATAVASTSGTSIDFTSLPAWVEKITVMFSLVSTNSTSLIQVQIGSGSVTTTGYSGFYGIMTASAVSGASSTTGFLINSTQAANNISGAIQIFNLSGNTWVASVGVGTPASGGLCVGGGTLTLGGVLDRVRITTVNGTDTFDAGSINIMYEG